MKQTPTIVTSDTCDDAPTLTPADFDRARYRLGNQGVSRTGWQSAVRARASKQRINDLVIQPLRRQKRNRGRALLEALKGFDDDFVAALESDPEAQPAMQERDDL
jgi:hypothetical protein